MARRIRIKHATRVKLKRTSIRHVHQRFKAAHVKRAKSKTVTVEGHQHGVRPIADIQKFIPGHHARSKVGGHKIKVKKPPKPHKPKASRPKKATKRRRR